MNNNWKAFLMIAVMVAMAAGCTDAGWSKAVGNLGNEATVTCYSAGVKIFEGRSTGKVSAEQGTGYYFKSAADGLFYEVSGDCVIKYDKLIPQKDKKFVP